MRFSFPLLFTLLISLASLQAQSPGNINTTAVEGEISIEVSPHIEYMLERHVQLNRKGGYLVGYRIQIYANSVVSTARKFKSGFDMKFPEFRSEIVLEEPDFKVLFGTYTDRFDAWRDLQLVLGKYPGSFIRQDLIAISDL